MRTSDFLQKAIRGLTKKIGVAKRNNDVQSEREFQKRRYWLALALGNAYDRWLLINEEGRSEFVDRAEFEQRMTAWARRRGLIPRANVNGPRIDASNHPENRPDGNEDLPTPPPSDPTPEDPSAPPTPPESPIA